MIPIKKILCPTDFSEPSYTGLDSAIEFAVHFSAELLLVHVVPTVHLYPSGPTDAGIDFKTYIDDVIDVSRKSLDETARNRVPSDLRVRTVLLQGNPADQIVDLARSEKVDMIITATHGWTGWRHFIFGSVAEKIVRLAGCPVMTVPAPQEE